MSLKLIDDTILYNIANAIRRKTNNENGIMLTDMESAIDNIQTGSNIKIKTITDYTIAAPSYNTQTLSFTLNDLDKGVLHIFIQQGAEYESPQPIQNQSYPDQLIYIFCSGGEGYGLYSWTQNYGQSNMQQGDSSFGCTYTVNNQVVTITFSQAGDLYLAPCEIDDEENSIPKYDIIIAYN